MTEKQLKYIIRHYDFDVNNKNIDYLYEISEKIQEDMYFSDWISDYDSYFFYQELYVNFIKEFNL
ncbi:MAG: hypothetical protein IJS60_01350 [Abditibacteriota bacterium]|nr:hypothetical protein [Abditibacteriota bacterium]